MISVTQYNLLSDALCTESQYPHMDINSRNSIYRYESTLEFLKNKMKDDSIICMQEVSMKWRGKLDAFFINNDYVFICVSYGNKFTGNMGIAIAYPKSYELISSNYFVVGQHIEEIIKHAESQSSSYLAKIIQYIKKLFGVKKQPSSYDFATWKKNILIKLGFKVEGKEFYIANYHMPCAYKYPEVMNYHIESAIKLAQKSTSTYPVIFAGYINIMPNSQEYNKIVYGIFNDKTIQSMKSSYASVHKSEPEFTNMGKDNFKGTLDYIFYKGDVECAESTIEGNEFAIIPNENYPSDHASITSKYIFN